MEDKVVIRILAQFRRLQRMVDNYYHAEEYDDTVGKMEAIDKIYEEVHDIDYLKDL